ncbi:unnamed protein product [Protopolystoma xenopodis]|uniref:Uncharacterized protein n=1 Tax=Protopolystoma xenopodis TaxID=117903 RepID=A0A3S5ALM3_9PLAT|nr:unnamed protein product [Protopolystoma xenopodis]
MSFEFTTPSPTPLGIPMRCLGYFFIGRVASNPYSLPVLFRLHATGSGILPILSASIFFSRSLFTASFPSVLLSDPDPTLPFPLIQSIQLLCIYIFLYFVGKAITLRLLLVLLMLQLTLLRCCLLVSPRSRLCIPDYQAYNYLFHSILQQSIAQRLTDSSPPHHYQYHNDYHMLSFWLYDHHSGSRFSRDLALFTICSTSNSGLASCLHLV